MNDRPSWVPSDVDVQVPSAARVYDYLLGGAHNFAIDRAVGEKVLQVMRNGTQIAGSNRAFMRRAVLHMLELGITQFLDLGSGIPTVGNVHEVAQGANPDAKVAYVDYDEVAVAHSELLLDDNENAVVVNADLTQPNVVLSDPTVHALLDFDKPIGLLMVAVFHFVPDEKQPLEILAAYRDALPAGSMLALSHLTADHAPEGMAGVVEAMKNSRDPMYFRPYDEVVSMFTGFELLEPGVVSAPAWHPERADETEGPRDVYVGVGRKE
ncbi:S-adenosyl methyltransferase [Herbihabitans rhizosphaerae]|uniref:S-adenosyl methyltransferase n=1 Tax=Herbihabitans rhizosphaerae TaxID=1872711 RepID=A0A4Q7KHU4_9PSEU|nr:SAM-dependent methyltransferase [Herbihabitans rhizosphaerae]RZS32837.1 S-adenosyl methyltransferase [Herbihabitans rhizosphaerae]